MKPKSIRLSVLCGLLLTAAGSALAQGGPPMVTDDPGTPGNGHWEINVGAISSRTLGGRRELAAPDFDINYGWGDHIQLKADIPWTTARDPGQPSRSGVGEGDFGVKWRFVDEETAGYSLSTYPQYSHSMLGSSNRRGITSPGHSFFLPIELSADIGKGFSLAAEVGRNFVSEDGGKNEWVAGFVLEHSCGEGLDCLAEVHQTQASGEHQTLLNFGVHWKLQESVTLLAAAGREFGTRTDERLKSLVYVGLQFTY